MNALIVILALIICGVPLFLTPNAGGALILCVVVSLPTLVVLFRSHEDRTFLMRVFVLGVLLRIVVGTLIYLGNYEAFFGGDANTYDLYAKSLQASWHGNNFHRGAYENFVASGASAWGMLYVMAAVYEIMGSNRFAIQLLNGSIGATTAVIVYHTAQHLFNNRRVSRITCILVCFFPSLVLWSSQALKDGIIVFILALAIFCTLHLMEKVTAGYVVVLSCCLLSLLTLRFYTFYMMAAAVGGSFLIGAKAMTPQVFLRRFVAVIAIGLVFTWFGVTRYAGAQFERYGNLKVVQITRGDQASAESGFMKDVDVQTTEGALTAIPVGVLYLLFAPFPWQLATLRQSIALPEMMIWWLAFPLLVLGLCYAVKHRIREVAPIVIFTTMLTLAYSLVQGNVGTAYRQRSQILVFYFIFVAVGAVILLERREAKLLKALREKKELADLQAARILARRQGTEMQSSRPVVGSS